MGTEWHAPYELLKPETQDMARALNSLEEELEAMDWYNRRIDVTHDEELRGILAHNRDEEKEHAAMVLEWIRRHDPSWDRRLRDYLFSEGSIVNREQAVEQGHANGAPGTITASIGSLRTRR